MPKSFVKPSTREKLRGIELLFVHNLVNNVEGDKELSTLQRACQDLLAKYGKSPERAVGCIALQIGRKEVLNWRKQQHSAIVVDDEIRLSTLAPPQKIDSPEWSALVLVVPVSEIAELKTKYGDALTSANVRDYLGSRQTARNINNQIKRTVKEESQNFWVYNNGITVLTNGFKPGAEVR